MSTCAWCDSSVVFRLGGKRPFEGCAKDAVVQSWLVLRFLLPTQPMLLLWSNSCKAGVALTVALSIDELNSAMTHDGQFSAGFLFLLFS